MARKGAVLEEEWLDLQCRLSARSLDILQWLGRSSERGGCQVQARAVVWMPWAGAEGKLFPLEKRLELSESGGCSRECRDGIPKARVLIMAVTRGWVQADGSG